MIVKNASNTRIFKSFGGRIITATPVVTFLCEQYADLTYGTLEDAYTYSGPLNNPFAFWAVGCQNLQDTYSSVYLEFEILDGGGVDPMPDPPFNRYNVGFIGTNDFRDVNGDLAFTNEADGIDGGPFNGSNINDPNGPLGDQAFSVLFTYTSTRLNRRYDFINTASNGQTNFQGPAGSVLHIYLNKAQGGICWGVNGQWHDLVNPLAGEFNEQLSQLTDTNSWYPCIHMRTNASGNERLRVRIRDGQGFPYVYNQFAALNELV